MVTIGNVRFEGKNSLVLMMRSCWFWRWRVVEVGGQKSLGLVGGFSLSIEGFHQSAPHLKGKRKQGQSCCDITLCLRGFISKRLKAAPAPPAPSGQDPTSSHTKCTPVPGWGWLNCTEPQDRATCFNSKCWTLAESYLTDVLPRKHPCFSNNLVVRLTKL